jgi:alkylation response protein AidB-like acyl-CoA dehydrogenase
MENSENTKKDWIKLTHQLGQNFEERAKQHDLEGKFVFANYKDLKEHKYFSAAIPKEHGGDGVSHSEMCEIIRTIAQYCSSTALAFSMHQHLIAAANWKLKNKNMGQSMLENVAKNELVLISTGARDWLGSNGELKTTNGGYLFSGKKYFASQSVAGDVVVTSAQFKNKEGNWEVLHFSAPMSADGISIADDWDVMGMRATGSQTIEFADVFIPDSAIALSRPKDEFHPVWGVVLTVALPLIMAAYVGIAEKAFQIALDKGKKSSGNSDQLSYMIGKLNNSLLSAQSQLKMMSTLTNDFDFKPNDINNVQVLSYKTNISEATKQVVSEAMEIVGGQSFYRSNTLERLFRDVQASPFHPLPKWDQYKFTGDRLLNS